MRPTPAASFLCPEQLFVLSKNSHRDYSALMITVRVYSTCKEARTVLMEMPAASSGACVLSHLYITPRPGSKFQIRDADADFLLITK